MMNAIPEPHFDFALTEPDAAVLLRALLAYNPPADDLDPTCSLRRRLCDFLFTHPS